jgi:hypothetical protein
MLLLTSLNGLEHNVERHEAEIMSEGLDFLNKGQPGEFG